MTTAVLQARADAPQAVIAPQRLPRAPRLSGVWPARIALTVVAAATAFYSTFLTVKTTAFEDEGLYLYMGHRVIGSWLHGYVLSESPGAYFSGDPGVYPPLAAVADHYGGLAAARALSLVFVLLAGLCVYGIARELYGRLAGVLANAAFLCNGSVLFQAHLATFDAMMMFLVSLAAYLGIRGARRNNLLYGLPIGAVLALAFLTKYTAVAFVPIVVGLCVTAGWSMGGRKVISRAAYVLVTAASLTYFWIQLFARDIVPGMESTTLARKVLAPASTSGMATTLLLWAGPWLIVAGLSVLGGARRDMPVRAMLLFGAVIVPLGQIHSHESTSYGKHMAFGMVFAAPLIGDLLSRVLRNTRFKGTPTVAGALVLLCIIGVTYDRRFATGWIDDRPLRAPLTAAIAANPKKVVLAEEGSAQRWELRQVVRPLQWADTFAFTYGGKSGMPAYEEAIDQSHFGVIYLSLTTEYGQQIHSYLISHSTPYILGSKAPRYLRGHLVGDWLIFVPRISA